MFFDSILLYKRHNGQLGIAWTAATRGVSLIKKEDVIKFDVTASCTVLIEYIISNSLSTKGRFSLRLSSILTNGILKLHARQAVLLFEEIGRVLIAVVKPPEVMSFEGQRHDDSPQFDTPPTPLPVTKSEKRTRKPKTDGDWRLKIPSLHSMQVLTPLEEDVPQVVPPTVAPWDDITMREADLGSTQEFVPDLDFGPPLSEAEVGSMFQLHGRQPQIEIPKHPLAQLTQNISSEDLSCHQVVVEVDVHVPALDETPSPKRLKASHVERSSQIEVPQPVIQELYSEILPERRVGQFRGTTQSAEVQDIEGVIQTMPSTVSDEEQVAKKRKTSKTAAEVPSEDVAIRDARTRDADRKRNLKHFVKTHPSRTRAVNINRSLPEELLDEPIILLPIEHMRGNFIFDLLPLYMTSPHDDETFPEVVIGDGRTSMPSILVTPPVDGMRRSVSRRPSFETTPLRRHGDGLIHEETIAEAYQLEERRSPIIKPTESFEPAFVSIPPDEPLESGQAIQVPAVPLSVQSVTDESSELIVEKWSTPRVDISDAVKVRHQVLLQTVLKYDETAQIKFDDLIPPPPTKLNAARTLSDLLDLGKARYVQLHTDTDESCELSYITWGPKLCRRH